MILGSIHPPASGPALDGCTLAQALGSVLLDPVLPHTPVPGTRAYRYLGIIRLCGPSPQALTVSASLALLRAGFLGFPGGSDDKEPACNVGDLIQSLGWEDPLERLLSRPISACQPFESTCQPVDQHLSAS